MCGVPSWQSTTFPAVSNRGSELEMVTSFLPAAVTNKAAVAIQVAERIVLREWAEEQVQLS